MSGGLTDNEKVFVEALSGAIGGFAGAVAFYPLDTVKTRIQVRHTPGTVLFDKIEQRKTVLKNIVALLNPKSSSPFSN